MTGLDTNTVLNALSYKPTSPTDMPYGLPWVQMTNDFYSTYAFTSLSATFLIKYGDSKITNIGCVSTTVTPDLGGLGWMLKILPLLVLLSVGFATIFASIFSPWGTTDIFHWTSNYGRDGDLLRLVTPGFGDCLQYIQFIALTGGLTLNYPGFYQPIVSQASWSALMFNESFVSKAPEFQALVDGIYYTNGTYGLQNLAQLVGMGHVEDIWAGMMVWLLVIIAAVLVITQIGFGAQWIYRAVKHIPEEDLRAKNLPFSIGNVVRIVFNYFLFPIVALSTFQLVVTGDSPAFTVALAVVTLVVVIGFAVWLLYLITTTKPRAFLYDDLPTVLLYGPLYNTFSDDAAAFALIPVLMTFIKGIAVGAVQPSGIPQVVLLAICEVIQIMTLHAFRPFQSATNMNAYHSLFSVLRLISVLLMTAFIPTLGVTEGTKGWIGYVILVIHAGVLIFGFFLNALQTIFEVVARLMGVGGDDARGLQRGGLSKIFGARQLQRRSSRRGTQSRQSQLSSTVMLDADEASKSGYIMPGGRLRSESAASMGVLLNNRQRSSSALDSLDITLPPTRQFESGASTFTPTTPGEASTFSFLPSPGASARHVAPPMAVTTDTNNGGDTFYRPPRRRRPTVDAMASPSSKVRGSWGSEVLSQQRNARPTGPLSDAGDLEDGQQIERGATPAPYANPDVNLTPRADYSTREVDFYYGVSRGERLNSDVPQRKLGTGPADPTGPMASAAGWFRNMLGGKSKEKGKGFEVVRSSRMPPAMKARGGDFGDETPPEGIPVAMGVLRNGPIESDDEDDTKNKSPRSPHKHHPGETELLAKDGSPQDEDEDDVEIVRVSDAPPMLPGIDAGESIHLPSRIASKASRNPSQKGEGRLETMSPIPDLPRKSSRRKSDAISGHSRDPSFNLAPPGSAGLGGEGTGSIRSSRLPFDRSNSQKRISSASSIGATEDFSQIDLQEPPARREERPTSYGYVQKGSISRIDPEAQLDLLGSSAEFVDK